MDELIIRVLRAVACFTRLRILARLAGADEVAPTALARELGLSLDLVCSHLARLASAGLIQRRRSGLYCYCVGRSPYRDGTLSGQISAWVYGGLRGTTPGARAPGRSARRQGGTADTLPSASDLIFDAATALAHPRRLQIMRHLAEAGAADVATLTRDLRMSGRAAERHLDKLVRRGFVRSSHREGRVVYHLAPKARNPLHARLLAIVRAHWRE